MYIKPAHPFSVTHLPQETMMMFEHWRMGDSRLCTYIKQLSEMHSLSESSHSCMVVIKGIEGCLLPALF